MNEKPVCKVEAEEFQQSTHLWTHSTSIPLRTSQTSQDESLSINITWYLRAYQIYSTNTQNNNGADAFICVYVCKRGAACWVVSMNAERRDINSNDQSVSPCCARTYKLAIWNFCQVEWRTSRLRRAPVRISRCGSRSDATDRDRDKWHVTC